MRPIFIVGVAVLIVLAASFVNTIPPSIPTAAASTPVGRTTGGDASGCFDRLARGTGWADTCWATYRVTAEADPEKDYYVLKLFTTYQGLRWAVFKTDLVGSPSGGSYSMWPDFDLDARCWSGPASVAPVGNPPVETICGPLKVEQDDGNWIQRVTWTCRSCILTSRDTNAVSLYDAVGVPQGTVPTWDLFVDGGS